MEIQAAYYSSIGGRKKNEDSLSLLEGRQGVIAIVADGLGGFAGGEIASRMTVQEINACLSAQPIGRDLLEEAVLAANQAVFEKNRAQMARMLSTVAVLWLDDSTACAANVGDSRIYQFRNRELIFQTQDHSVSGMAYLLGEISYADIRKHADRNKLVRAIGNLPTVKADIVSLSVCPGDVFVLCSDGFWEYIYEEEIAACLDPDASVKEWLEQMRKIMEGRFLHDNDNNSCIILKT